MTEIEEKLLHAKNEREKIVLKYTIGRKGNQIVDPWVR
jgi:hypothetical protein